MAVSTFPRNGATQRPGGMPTPLLLAPVILPFRGPGYSDAGPITILYDVPRVRAFVEGVRDQQGRVLAVLDLADREAAILANTDLPDAEKQTQIDALLLDGAHRIIGETVYGVEWPYSDPPPDPRHPDTFDLWDAQVVLWVAFEGVLIAGAQYAGPLAGKIPGRS